MRIGQRRLESEMTKFQVIFAQALRSMAQYQEKFKESKSFGFQIFVSLWLTSIFVRQFLIFAKKTDMQEDSTIFLELYPPWQD